MYKLVVVGGKKRGLEYVLKEGENILGSDSTLDIVLTHNSLSKKHCKITLDNNSLFLEDLGSTNGTILNGSLILQKKLEENDLIAIPGYIFKIIYKKDPILTEEEKKLSLQEKILLLFKKNILPLLLTLNKDYEWRFLWVSFLVIFTFLGTLFSFIPVFNDQNFYLEKESLDKAEQFIQEAIRKNTLFLANKRYEEVQIDFLDNKDGVLFYELMDKEGRILRPSYKMNTFSADSFSLETLSFFGKNSEEKKFFSKKIQSNEYGVGKVIKAFNEKAGREETVGYLTLKILPTNLLLMQSKEGIQLIKSFFILLFFALLSYFIVYYLTKFHLTTLQEKAEEVLKTPDQELKYDYKVEEFYPLISLFNSLLTKIKSYEGVSPTEEDAQSYLDLADYFHQLASTPCVLLNGEKLVYKINSSAEELLGLRQSSTLNQSFLELIRDPGLSSQLLNLIDQCQFSTLSSNNYEIGGRNYALSVLLLKGKDLNPKAYFLQFKSE